MPRYSELRNRNTRLGTKYGIKRDIVIHPTPNSSCASVSSTDGGGGGDVFASKTHVSRNIQESLQWFQQQKSQLISRGGGLFEDPFFPANDTTLAADSVQRGRRIEWKRPQEFCQNAHFLVEGISRFDVRQGELGDCWLLAAVSSLSMFPNLFQQVVIENQEFGGPDYCGAFMFRFWQFGTWLDVVVDDRLPVHNGKLLYMHSTEGNEFWSALLEKAYAKLSWTYESLKGGSSSEAMEDFTGGITEMFDLGPKTQSDLWEIMLRATSLFSLMGCSIEASPGEIEAKAEKGLIKGHAYSITDVKTVHTRNGEVYLVRIRNPWGNSAEWTGKWSDQSREWKNIADDERRRLGLVFSDDGEFWMNYDDFKQYFTKLEICHQGPELAGEDGNSSRSKHKKARWEMCLENGEWQNNVSAGGCRNFIATFHMNPQFRVTVVDPDEHDDDNKGTLIVGLMQKERRSKKREGQEMLTIGYVVYQLKNNSYDNRILDTTFFRTNASVAKSPSFINLREICGRHKLAPGKYVIVPSSFNPSEEASFLLRIFSEKPYDSTQMDQKTEIVDLEWRKDLTPQQQREEEENNSRLKMAFDKIAGEDGELDAFELQQVLNSAFKKELLNSEGFSIETCRSMLAMMDSDLSGKLGFEEFKVLWNDLRLWKTIFKQFDVDHNGNFNVSELRQGLVHIGFRVSNRIFTAVCTRYSNKKGEILFDDYILMVARLKTVFLSFKARKKPGTSEAIFPQEEFMQSVLYM